MLERKSAMTMTMSASWKLALAVLALAVVSTAASAQAPTVTAPSSRTAVKAAPDYATEVLHDRWDMNERTDLGWRIFNTVEQYPSFLANISFAGGIFQATTAATPGLSAPSDSDCNITILDSAYPGSAYLGKVGANYKIDADKYQTLLLRMSISGTINAWPTGQLFWSKNTIYNDITASGAFFLRSGWAYYVLDIPALGTVGGNNLPWSGLVDSLRLDPGDQSGKTVRIDWIRLVQKGSTYNRTITWTGAASADIYLDNDQNPGNGNLGLLAKSVSGGSYAFPAGGLAAGNYYVAVAPAGTTNFGYSPGYYAVQEQPIVRITRPSDEGSDEDFITVAAGNPWDLAASNDVDHMVNVVNPSYTTLDYEDLAGRPSSGHNVLLASSAPAVPGNVGDPMVFLLNFAFRGAVYQIDTSRYHNLVLKLGISGTHSTNDGSVARVTWMRTDEHHIGENVSQDIIIRHLPDRWVMHKVVADLKTLPIEEGGGSPSHSGWTGTVDTFRVDPHEFSDPRTYFIDDVKITADWRADFVFSVEGAYSDADSGGSLSLYYDTDRSGFNGTPAHSTPLALPAAGEGTWGIDWDTTGVSDGTYHLYAVITDADGNTNRAYAGGPVIVDHSGMPGASPLTLSKKAFVFGAVSNGPATPAGTTLLMNAGELNWTTARSHDWISVSPASGTGDAAIAIGVARTNLSPGTYYGTVTVADSQAPGSPQTVQVTFNVYAAGEDGAPFGMFEFPAHDATVRSSIAVCGWVLDDIAVSTVKIYRAPVAGESGVNRVFIGDAVFVRGARPDVEAAFPLYPRADQAGWGYMMLTNFLPNGGNGTFEIMAYATDATGHEVGLGTKTIHCDNASAVNPFGAIDTPAQGGTASGSAYLNWGWALTPQPKFIPVDGSTILVWIDGAPLGRPSYGYPRADIQSSFPGYMNTDSAVGYYALDTTSYPSGVHNICWSVTDSGGAADGIGSRYFNILNVSGASGAPEPIGGTVDLARAVEDPRTPVYVRRGYDPNGHPRIVLPGADGASRIDIPALGRVAVYLNENDAYEGLPEMAARGLAMRAGRPARREKSAAGAAAAPARDASPGYGAFLLVRGEARPLPAGSSFDPRNGVFYWSVGPGFLGEYTLVLVREDGGTPVRKTVNIRVHPGPPFLVK